MRKNNTHRAGTPRALIGFTPALCRAPSPLRPPRAGWWGLARHFHYLPELAAAFFWCLPAGGGRALPFFYFFPFLTLLLLDRAFRDDARCAAKYGAAWVQYCKAVPYRMIPYVF